MINYQEEIIIISRDSKDKVRLVHCGFYWSDDEKGFIITRKTGQLKGKLTNQPDKIIKMGKANRTVTEQTRLEYNSIISKYKDKGYKDIPQNYMDAILSGTISEDTLEIYIPKGVKTDSNGNLKPQLAKDFHKISSAKTLNKRYFASKKLDGVRCYMFLNEDGEIATSSRGGKQYDFATQYIRECPELINLFEKFPKIILDGELYKHGKSLQYVSGTARIEDYDNSNREERIKRMSELEFHVYDIVDLEKSFEDRLEFINDELVPLFDETNKVFICEHEEVEGWLYVEKLHNKYVDEGYEGLVLREPSKEYKPNARDNRMIKVKLYQDDEFEIVGYTEGKVRDSDFSFTCITKDGKEFGATPMGTVEERLDYLENMESLIGKKATVKFFNYSDDGVPTQTHLKCIRDYE